MKGRNKTILMVVCLLMFTCCGVVTSLPPNTYAELRLGDGGKRQLLVETDQWRGAITPEGYQGNKHWTQCWFNLQGAGPIYQLSDDEGHGYKRVGTITIDERLKKVTINLRHIPDAGGEITPYLYNGTYVIASINNQPFYN